MSVASGPKARRPCAPSRRQQAQAGGHPAICLASRPSTHNIIPLPPPPCPPGCAQPLGAATGDGDERSASASVHLPTAGAAGARQCLLQPLCCHGCFGAPWRSYSPTRPPLLFLSVGTGAAAHGGARRGYGGRPSEAPPSQPSALCLCSTHLMPYLVPALCLKAVLTAPHPTCSLQLTNRSSWRAFVEGLPDPAGGSMLIAAPSRLRAAAGQPVPAGGDASAGAAEHTAGPEAKVEQQAADGGSSGGGSGGPDGQVCELEGLLSWFNNLQGERRWRWQQVACARVCRVVRVYVIWGVAQGGVGRGASAYLWPPRRGEVGERGCFGCLEIVGIWAVAAAGD